MSPGWCGGGQRTHCDSPESCRLPHTCPYRLIEAKGWQLGWAPLPEGATVPQSPVVGEFQAILFWESSGEGQSCTLLCMPGSLRADAVCRGQRLMAIWRHHGETGRACLLGPLGAHPWAFEITCTLSLLPEHRCYYLFPIFASSAVGFLFAL